MLCVSSLQTEGSRTSSLDGGVLQGQPSGTLTSLFRAAVWLPGWLLTQLLGAPCRLGRRAFGAVRVTRQHLLERQDDYGFLYMLLSLGMPLLAGLHDVLAQMLRMEEPPLTQLPPPPSQAQSLAQQVLR